MIKELKARYADKSVLVCDYVEFCLKNAEKHNAFTKIYRDEAIAAAKIAQQNIDAGEIKPLSGIPVAVKDNICLKGKAVTCGSNFLKDFVSPYTATALEKLIENGAIIIGKTNMDEFGMGSHSQNSAFGGVENPLNSAYSPGGSSGGSAVAVKSQAAVVALGSDTGGSIRLPASYCGLYGMRPTYGAVSRYGLVAFASSMDTVAVIGTSAEDCEIIYSIINGYDKNDNTSCKTPKTESYREPIKIGSFCNSLMSQTEKQVGQSVQSFLCAAKGSGATVTEVDFPQSEYIVPAYYLLSSAEASSNLSRFDGINYGLQQSSGASFEKIIAGNRSIGFGTEVKRRILLGNYALSHGYYNEYYLKARAVKAELQDEMKNLLQRFNILVLPTSLKAVPKLCDTASIKETFLNDKCCALASLCGLPSISVPFGTDKNGMPIGISLIGNKFCEKQITDFATGIVSGAEV